MIQLCLEHGFRRVELERMGDFVVSSKQEPFTLIELNLLDDDEEQSKGMKKKSNGIFSGMIDWLFEDDDDDDENKLLKKKSNKDKKKVEEQEPYDEDSIFALHNNKNDPKQRKFIIKKPISRFLKQELEDYFTAVVAENQNADPSFLDAAFSIFPSQQHSPFFSAKSTFQNHIKNNKLSALANISSEVYGRYVPGISSKVKFIGENRGEAEIVYPNGDACFNHHEMSQTSWTTYLRFVCSMNEIGKKNRNNVGGDPIKWDVRVNAPQCMVIVLVFTDVVC